MLGIHIFFNDSFLCWLTYQLDLACKGIFSAKTMDSERKRKGLSNLMLRTMGISGLRFPSRRWCVFWSVLALGVGGIVYDKYEQKKMRTQYIVMLEAQRKSKQDVWVNSRKVTVLIAPPPGDYLETSMKIWRRNLKGLLYHAGIDYEVITEERQGIIRHEIAERILQLRKDLLKTAAKLEQAERDSRWLNRIRSWWSVTERLSESELEELKARRWREEFSYRQILGVYYKHSNIKETISEDAMVGSFDPSGGVICIGRGAYKEYISGVMEGVLGPLYPPISEESTLNSDSIAEEETKADTEKPYIRPTDYSHAQFPPELDLKLVKDPHTGIPVLYQQPLLVIGLPTVSGIRNIPKRIYRFYTSRHYAEQCYKAVTAMILKQARPFDSEHDVSLASEEEEYWPKSWVKRGQERGSEWVQDLATDVRVLSHMHVIDPDV